MNQYTQSTDFILSNSKNVKDQAIELAEGKDDLYEIVFDTSEWVNENIEYSLSTLTAELVQDANWVLNNRKGVCDELTVLFISMLRSIDIPARFVSGTSYTSEIKGFGNHAWAEVYFPGYGWVSFDPTYGQMGYVDATHIKMRDSIYAKESAVNYEWTSKNIDVTANKLEIDTTPKNNGPKLQPLVNMNIKTLNTEVKSGSTVPIEIELSNPHDYYIPVTLYIRTAPTIIEDNGKHILLKPKQQKSVFWAINLPTNTEKGYTYTTSIEIVDFFGSIGSTDIVYGDSFEFINQQNTRDKIDKLTKSEEKTYNQDVNFKCNSKDSYYLYEINGNIICNLKNKGNVNLDNIEVCLEEDCKNLNLKISDKSTITFNFPLELGNYDAEIKLSNNDLLIYDYVPFVILEDPGLKITNLKYPNTTNYKSIIPLEFRLSSKAPFYNTKIFLNGKRTFQEDSITSNRMLNIDLPGNFFYKNQPDITVIYEDENGKEYTTSKELQIQITNPPFYANFIHWINNIF